MPSEPPSALLDRVRKLLAKAEAEGVTPPEAEALTAKAAELMARYGLDRGRLGRASTCSATRRISSGPTSCTPRCCCRWLAGWPSPSSRTQSAARGRGDEA